MVKALIFKSFVFFRASHWKSQMVLSTNDPKIRRVIYQPDLWRIIPPATKHLKVVIPVPHHVRDKLQPESRRALDAPVSSTGQAYQVRHDGVILFNCRVNKRSFCETIQFHASPKSIFLWTAIVNHIHRTGSTTWFTYQRARNPKPR